MQVLQGTSVCSGNAKFQFKRRFGSASETDAARQLGGPASPRGVFPQVEAYDPASDTWTLVDTMPTPRHGFSAVPVGDRLYLPGGSTRQGGFGYGRTTLLDTYTPD